MKPKRKVKLLGKKHKKEHFDTQTSKHSKFWSEEMFYSLLGNKEEIGQVITQFKK